MEKEKKYKTCLWFLGEKNNQKRCFRTLFFFWKKKKTALVPLAPRKKKIKEKKKRKKQKKTKKKETIFGLVVFLFGYKEENHR